ncbi:hypothetical protein CR970_03495 [Candidatus Saccharibacteria bacterium]|nr:MAG: hypothetical protein CR970_03495 [Candidatus Saccharibacteria bacterium]
MSQPTFDASFFIGNRRRLRQLFTGSAPIVVTGNAALQKSADMAFPFHQDSNFWYLTGIELADVVLVMDKDTEYLIMPERSEVQDLFEGTIDQQALAERSGVSDILPAQDGWKRLSARIKRVKHVATMAADDVFMQQHAMYANPARAQLMERLRSYNESLELLNLREHLMHMRFVKQEPELAAIREAIRITAATLREVTRPSKMTKYAHEYQIEAAVSHGFRRRGAVGHAYDPIVAAGRNACVLHYTQNNDQLADNQLVLMDVGAQYSHYAADITRTVIRGEPTKRQRAVHDAVRQIHDFGVSLLKPGAVFLECEQEVRRMTGEKLRELGLIKTIDAESVHRYYPHAPHFLGLDVHDVGDYSAPLQPGVVLTIEPGIYIPEENIGVRIENDIVITSDGHQNLSADLPYQLA